MEYYPFRLSNGVASFSPNGLFVASVVGQKLTIRSSIPDAYPTQLFLCAECVEYIEWSTDSELIISGYLTKGKLEIWSVVDPDWKCKIHTGLLGLQSVCFAPGSRHILTTAELSLRITIWSLVDRSVRHINLPKDAEPGLDFSPGGSYLAVAERRSAKDFVVIYSCESWTEVTVIDPETIDLGGVKWSPDSSKIAIWDRIHAGKVSIYSIGGSRIAQLDTLGIHNVDWSPSAQIVAAAIAGSKILLINHLTWRPISTLTTRKTCIEDNTCVIYAETDNHLKYHVLAERPIVLGETPSGQLRLAFSPDARYLAAVDQHRPKLLWLWDIPKLSLKSILIHQSAIKCFAWSPVEPRLAIVCGTSSLYLWTPLGCAIFSNLHSSLSSSALRAEKVQWNANGHQILVCSREAASVGTFK